MKIRINGREVESKGRRLGEILESIGVKTKEIVIQINGELVDIAKSQFKVITEKDEIEWMYSYAGASGVTDSNHWYINDSWEGMYPGSKNYSGSGDSADPGNDWFKKTSADADAYNYDRDGINFGAVGITEFTSIPEYVAQAALDFDGYVNALSQMTQNDGEEISITAATVLTTQVQIAQSISEMAQGIAKSATDTLKKQAQKLGGG